MPNVIQLHDALAATDEKTGETIPLPFSIKFWKANGELVHIPQAVRCGTRGHQRRNKTIGVRPLRGGHIYTVFIYWIESINNQSIYW